MSSKRLICEHSNLSLDSMVLMGGPGCSRLSETPPTHCSKRTTTFDEEIHASGHDSASPATILEHAEDAELIRKAMEELPVDSREILTLRHQEGLSYKEIADVAQILPGTVMSRLARARAKLSEYLAAQIGKEK